MHLTPLLNLESLQRCLSSLQEHLIGSISASSHHITSSSLLSISKENYNGLLLEATFCLISPLKSQQRLYMSHFTSTLITGFEVAFTSSNCNNQKMMPETDGKNCPTLEWHPKMTPAFSLQAAVTSHQRRGLQKGT